jgi:hypothetical protein
MPTSLSNNIATALQTTYFDDFNEDKRYYRILFRPSVAVQARELTQLQTILQNQVSRLGDYNFKDGSIVDGIHLTYRYPFPFVRLVDTFNANTSKSVTEYDQNYLITNSANGTIAVKAYVGYSARGYKANYPDTNIWYLTYVQTGKDGSNNDITEFQSGDTLYVYDTTQDRTSALDPGKLLDSISVITSNSTVNATGYGYGVTTQPGVIYQKGFFATVPRQTAIIRKYDNQVNNYVIGFETQESIVTENQDPSLNDNANGSTNYNAPGAHRLQLTPTLVARPKSDVSNNFFAIAEFDNSKMATQNQNANDPTAKLLDSMAIRTYDTNGDYVVNPFTVDTTPIAGSPNNFYYTVSTGTAYIQGYKVNKIQTVYVTGDRAVNTNIEKQIGVTADVGGFVIVNQAEGIFNNEILSSVALYDTAQTSLSDRENASSAPAGSIIGYANVRGMQYYSGTKGLYSTQYALFIFNVKMNSGSSFSQVRSFVQNTGGSGYARADAVLSGGVAVLNDSSRTATVFDTGFKAVKTLVVNGASSSETSFNFRQISSTTMAANGTATFNLDTVAPGGPERLGISVGNYSTSSILNQFNIAAGAAVWSANLTGNVAITSGNTTVVGTGTSFTTQIANGELIRVANSSTSVLYQVNAVSNNTILTLVQTPGASYATYQFGHYYPEGHIFNISSVNAISGGISFTINTGLSLSSTLTVYGSYPVTKSTAVAAKKDEHQGTYVKIDCSNNTGGTVGPWDLGLVDVHNIQNIYVGTTYANTNPDYSSWFTLDNGQRDDMYDHAKLYIKPQYAANLTGSNKLLVKLDHFTANTTAGVGFFTVDSYPIDDANTANTTAIQTAQIPLFQSPTAGPIDLRNAIDFRPLKYNTATVTTDPTAASINPAVSNTSFNITSTNQYMVEPSSTIAGDFEYYLPRYDILTMTKDGTIYPKEGRSAVYPQIPVIENDTMALAQVYVPPYPSLTTSESEQFNRRDLAISTTIKTHKRYTMADIGKFEDRIKRLEYYVVLNALEQNARDMNIPSASNPALNRFKNGIFAEPFHSFDNADVSNFEFKAAIDPPNSTLRPFFNQQPIDFVYDTANSTTVNLVSAVMAPYTHVHYISQPFTTGYRNVTATVWQWNGNLQLFPSYDYFVDTTQGANVAVNVDTSTPWKQFASSPFGTVYGQWRTTNITNTSTSSSSQSGDTIATTTTTTTATTQARTVQSISVDTVAENYNIGNLVTDVSISPYLRSRIVAVVANNLKPNTTLHAFFDGVLVDQYVAPGVLSGTTTEEIGKSDDFVNQAGNYGDRLVSTSDGKFYGLFKIPAATFRTGDRSFRLANVTDLINDAGAVITSAAGTYSGSSTTLTKQQTTLTVIEPTIVYSANQQQQTLTSTSSTTSYVTLPPQNTSGGGGGGAPHCGDPLGQAFIMADYTDGGSGAYISKIGVFFQAVDSNPNNGITLFVNETLNGYPNKLVTVGRARLLSSQCSVSATGTVETQFVLDEPFLASTGKMYTFALYPDGNSPEWTVFTAQVGGVDLNTGQNIYSAPSAGNMFISSNYATWTAVQKEFLQYNIYRANFTTGDFYAYFNNEDDEFITTGGFTRANTAVAIEIGDIVYTANSTGGPNTFSNAAFGRVSYVDEPNNIVYLDKSTNGKFFAANNINIYRTPDSSNTAYVTNTYLIANATISSVNNLQYQAVVPKFGMVQPVYTSITYSFEGTDASYLKDSSYQSMTNELEYEYLDKSRYVVSKSNEIANMSGTKSATYSIKLSTSSPFVSPAVSLKKKSSIFVNNLINNDITNEYTRYGNATTKYVSKAVVLADGQEAEDLQVFVSMYRPTNSNVYVYAKFWNNTDGETFVSKNWTLLNYLNGTDAVYSNPTDRTDIREYQFGIGSSPVNTNDAYLDQTNSGILTYVNAGGSKFVTYKTFAIKIVLVTSNPAKIPMVHDLRAIAMQV